MRKTIFAIAAAAAQEPSIDGPLSGTFCPLSGVFP
jgi:hypothetical protein